MQFRGSDDYLRAKFEEYVSAALASVRYRDFVAKGEINGVLITGGSGGDANSTEDFNPLWISEFKKTNAFEVWDRTTDPMLFDIVEPRHPCNEKPSVVGDIGLRISEGIQELKLEQQLAPTREAISRTLTAGSTGFFKAVEGVRGRWQWAPSSSSTSLNHEATSGSVSSISSTPVDISPPHSVSSISDLAATPKDVSPPSPPPKHNVPGPPQSPNLSRKQSSVDLGATATHAAQEARAAVGAWGAGIGSFLSTRASRFSIPKVGTTLTGSARSSVASSPVNAPQTQPQPEARLSPPPPPPTVEEPAKTPIFAPTVAMSRVKAAVAAVEARLPETKEVHHEDETLVKDLDHLHTNPSPDPSSESVEAQKVHDEELGMAL